jgi:hypothetical protein
VPAVAERRNSEPLSSVLALALEMRCARNSAGVGFCQLVQLRLALGLVFQELLADSLLDSLGSLEDVRRRQARPSCD